MARIIAIANQKGGVGKTTTAVNLAAGLARGITGSTPKRVLLVDMDSQANTTAVFLTAQFTLGQVDDLTIYEVVVHQTPAENAIKSIALPAYKKNLPEASLDLIPSHIRLAQAELELIGISLRREYRLADSLTNILPLYDYVVIDCPPSLGLLTINALIAANEVLIASEPSNFSLIGITLLKRTIYDVARINQLETAGIVLTRLDRTNEAKEIVSVLDEHFGDKILPSIPNRVAIREAHSNHCDIFGYTGLNNDAAIAYADLTKEVENRMIGESNG